MPTIEHKFSSRRLVEARKRANVRRELLAFSLGVSVQSVANWEQGRVRPRQDRIEEIARTLGCAPDDLLEGADDGRA